MQTASEYMLKGLSGSPSILPRTAGSPPGSCNDDCLGNTWRTGSIVADNYDKLSMNRFFPLLDHIFYLDICFHRSPAYYPTFPALVGLMIFYFDVPSALPHIVSKLISDTNLKAKHTHIFHILGGVTFHDIPCCSCYGSCFGLVSGTRLTGILVLYPFIRSFFDEKIV